MAELLPLRASGNLMVPYGSFCCASSSGTKAIYPTSRLRLHSMRSSYTECCSTEDGFWRHSQTSSQSATMLHTDSQARRTLQPFMASFLGQMTYTDSTFHHGLR